MQNGIVGRTTDGFFRYQAWPTVTKDEKGVLYAASSGHRLGHVCPFGKNYLYISHDQGESWLGPIIANDNYMDDRDAGILAWGDGKLLLSWFSHPREFYATRETQNPSVTFPLSKAARQEWETLSDADHAYGSFVKLSTDGGKTWGQRIAVPVTAPHGPIRRKDGSFLYFGRAFQSGDPACPEGAICAVESRDGGNTWQRLGIVPQNPKISANRLHEPYVAELPDGTLFGAIRVNRLDKTTDNTMVTTVSRDGGKTWSVPKATGIGGTPPHLMIHSSGKIVLSYGRRVAPCGQAARISSDGGNTWSEEIFVSPESPDWDCGYPSSVELRDGSILTVYYQKYPGDTYNSILSTRWELPKEG